MVSTVPLWGVAKRLRKAQVNEDAIVLRLEPIDLLYRDEYTLVVARETASWAILDPDGYRIYTTFDGERSLREIAEAEAISIDDLIEIADQLFISGVVAVNGVTRLAQNYFKKTHKQPRYPHLCIFHMHNFCNLACKYCYTEWPGMPRGKMSLEVLCKAVEEMLQLPVPIVAFEFHGGEPMMGWKKIHDTVLFGEELAAKLGKKILWNIQTNGTYINDERARFFADHRFNVRVSIDGPAEMHDFYRINHRGRGSFDAVIKGIKALQNAKINFGTVTVVNNNNIDHLDEVLDFLIDLDVRSVRFNPLFVQGMAESEMRMVAEKWAQKELALVKRVVEYNRANPTKKISMPNIYLGYIVNIFSWDRPYLCNASPCGAAGGIANIAVNGDVYPCEEMNEQPTFKLGNLFETSLKDLFTSSPIITTLKSRVPDNLPVCNTCTFKYMCGGGCGSKTFHQYGTIFRESDYCAYYKHMYEEMIWYILEAPDYKDLLE